MQSLSFFLNLEILWAHSCRLSSRSLLLSTHDLILCREELLFERVNRAPLLSHLERKFSGIHPSCDRLQKGVLRRVVCVHAQTIRRFSFSCACSSQSVMAPSILWDRMYWLLESAAGLNLQVENSNFFILL
jgi:hypothetical protein